MVRLINVVSQSHGYVSGKADAAKKRTSKIELKSTLNI